MAADASVPTRTTTVITSQGIIVSLTVPDRNTEAHRRLMAKLARWLLKFADDLDAKKAQQGISPAPDPDSLPGFPGAGLTGPIQPPPL